MLRETVKGIPDEKVITIHTHFYADFDAIISAYLIHEYIEKGEETYTLKALAEIYEQKEQIYENEQFKNNGELARDYSKRRERNDKESRFSEAPFSHTADSWFFSEKEDMIDSPGNRGSQLSLDEMREILYNYTSLIKKSFLVEYTTGDAGTFEVSRNETNLLEWKKECRDKLSRHSDIY